MCSAVRVIPEHRHSCLCAKQAFLPGSSPNEERADSPLGAQAASLCSVRAMSERTAEKKSKK